MADRLQEQDGRWATLLISAPNDSDRDRVPRELHGRLEPAARRLARGAGVSTWFYYFNYGPQASVQLVLVAAGLTKDARERLVRALGNCAARWERRGWAAKSLYGFMNIERGLAGFGGPAGLEAVEALEAAASLSFADALRRGSILRMPQRTAFALCFADAVLDAVCRAPREKLQSTAVWRTAYAALLERDGFSVEDLPAQRLSATVGELHEALEPWQGELLTELQVRLRAPGAALRAGVLAGNPLALLFDAAWRRVIHQTWLRLGLSQVEETIFIDWLSSIYGPHD